MHTHTYNRIDLSDAGLWPALEILKSKYEIMIMENKRNYNSPCVTVSSSKLRTSILAGSNGIGGKNTGEDFTFGSRERQIDVQTTNID